MPTLQNNKNQLTFWEHLDDLKSSIVRIVVAIVGFGMVAFMFKEPLFKLLLAPKYDTFVTYRLLQAMVGGEIEGFSVELINTGLAQQFMVHLKAAFAVGILLASPYIIYQLFKFVSPALYSQERSAAVKLVTSGYIMFLLGVALNYFVIFPLTFRFLGTYQVSTNVENLITIDSYMSTLLMLSLMMGVMFEIPVLSWLMAKIGVLTASFMRTYRRHALVVILILAAVITPTTDIFTLLVVSLPIYLLYEVSIFIVRRCKKS